jgi:hypothetical protein
MGFYVYRFIQNLNVITEVQNKKWLENLSGGNYLKTCGRMEESKKLFGTFRLAIVRWMPVDTI